jgi:hypothetical protein
MCAITDLARFVDDLAGHWTDRALKVLKDSGVNGNSVALELETWNTLRSALHAEFRKQQAMRPAVTPSFTSVMRRAFHRATTMVARQFGSPSSATDVESRVQPWFHGRERTLLELGVPAGG